MTDDALAARLRSIFAEELEEQLVELNQELLALERAPADAERLAVVFRVMHTLKGASRAVGLKQLEDVCHVLEHDLGHARDRKIPLGGGQIALLFEAADALGDLLERLRAGRAGDTDALGTLLSHARERRPDVTPPVMAPVTAPVMDPVMDPVMAPVAVPISADAATESVTTLPEPESTERTGEVRERHVRVSLAQVDSIAGMSGEIAALASVALERTEALASLRGHLRRACEGGADRDATRSVERQLTALVRALREDGRTFSNVSARLGVSAQRLRQRPLSELTEPMARVVRDIAHDLGKRARLAVEGAELEADRVVLEALRDPLLHLIRNAVDHGLELPAVRAAAGKDAEGEVRIVGTLRGDRMRVAVSDDGAGLALDTIARKLRAAGRAVPADRIHLMRTVLDDGFTTRDVLTTVSGRGVGLGVVRAAVERMGGSVEIDSEAGRGTTITLDVPLSVATMRVLLVQVGEVIVGIPSTAILRVMRIDAGSLVRVDDRTVVSIRGTPVVVRTLASLLGAPYVDAPPAARMQSAVIESGGRKLVVIVDDLVDERELILRPVDQAGTGTETWSVGSAVLGSGQVAVVLNAAALVAEDAGAATSMSLIPDDLHLAKPRVLVVDDSITSRTLEESVLNAHGYDVVTAVDGAAAWRIVEREDLALVVSDVEMPQMDGFTLCETIRANPRTARLPVVLVTSLDDDAQRARGMAAGADAYITKSGFDQDTLLETVRMLIGDVRAGRR